MKTLTGLAKIEAKIEDAAKLLNPILADRRLSRLEIECRVHDALNALTVARAETEFLR